MTHHPDVLSFSPAHIKSIFQKKMDGIYIPVTVLTFSLEHRLFGVNTFIYHLDNLLLHLAVVVLVFYFALSLRININVAFLGALIFALHPSKVELIAWVEQRKEILGTFLCLVSLFFYVQNRKRISFVVGVCSMFASPLVIILPFILIIMDWWKEKILNVKKVFDLWPYFLVTLIVGFLNYKAFLNWLRTAGKSCLFMDHLFYFLSIVLSLLIAYGVFRFYQFLKNQEAIIRQLFIVALGTLVMGLILLTYTQSLVWQNKESLWRHYVKKSPQLSVYLNLAESLKESNEYRQSQNDYRAYVDLIAQGASENKLAIDKAKLAKVQDVIDLYKQAIRLFGKTIDPYLALGRIYEDIGKFDDALACYIKAIEIDSKSKEALFALGGLYQKMNKPTLAIEQFNRLLKLYPEDENVYVYLIKAYSNAIERNPHEKLYQEQRENVLSDFEEISKRKKYTDVDYCNLGFLYEQVGGYEEAVRFYRKSLELNPRYEKALLSLGNRYQQMGDYKGALLMYQQLLHFHPKNAQGYLNMGIIYNALSDVDRSRMFYQKAIDLDPTNAKPYYYLGYLCELAGELKDALNYYEKSIEQDPQQAEAYYNMGNVYAQLGQEAEALASYLKTIAINKNHQNAYVNLSILSFKSRDFAGAIRYLEEAQLLGYNPPVEYLKSLEPYRKKK